MSYDKDKESMKTTYQTIQTALNTAKEFRKLTHIETLILKWAGQYVQKS